MTSIHTLRKNEYADFLRLWGEAFGDGAEVHEGMKSVYGPEWKDFVVILGAPRGEDPGKAAVPGKATTPGKAAVPDEPAVAAALSQFAFGKLNNRVVLVSYAISTAKQLRGKGYGSMITRYARDVARILGAESMLCPADEGLVKFYKTLGYEPHCFACDFDVAKNEAGRAAYETAKFERINALRYNELREKYLGGANMSFSLSRL